jgi:hypothetical protein
LLLDHRPFGGQEGILHDAQQRVGAREVRLRLGGAAAELLLVPRSIVEAMRLDVERRMRRGERFTDVENVINTSALSSDEKSALWLLAWSYVHPRAHRREANAHLRRVTATTSPRPNSGRHLRIAR